jgi:hypothetical protein
MTHIKILPIFIMMIACAVMSIACSNGNSPVEPSTNEISGISNDLPMSIGAELENRDLLAVYDASIDPAAETFTITPDNRTAQYHFPLTQMYPNVLKITGYGFTPNLWADIKLVHPYPGSGIKGYDPRVIAILPANSGVRFIYPVHGVGGNNAVVKEPDGYTGLHDSLGGSIPGNVNPFKAYFKNQPYRVWSGTGVTEETQRWQMNIAGFGGPLQFKLVVDVSTNYPNPPQPIIDNAKEPVRIDAKIGPGLSPEGGSGEIIVALLDWQGHASISGVMVEAPDLFIGTVNLAYSAPGPNPNEYIYSGFIANSKMAPVGEYKILISALDSTTGIFMYDEFTARVSETIAEGNLIRAKQAGGSAGDFAYTIATLSDDSVVVVGDFEISALFGKGDLNETMLESSGDSDAFIAKYYNDGTLAWAKSAGGTAYDGAWGVTALSDDSTVAIGAFNRTATFGSGEPNETELTSAGEFDIFIARYSPDGALAWAKRVGGPDNDDGIQITSLSDNSVVITGEFAGAATFGPGEPNQTILTSFGSWDVFIARYNPNGTLAWAKQAGGSEWDCGKGITTLSDNSTVVSGFFTDISTFGPGEVNETQLESDGTNDIFIARYNASGNLVWAKSAGGSLEDGGTGVAAYSDDSTCITGYFSDLATFGSGEPNQTVLTTAGSWDVFVARYNPDGSLSWAKSAGGSEWDVGNDVAIMSDNSAVITGYFIDGPCVFGLDEPNETTLISDGYLDIYVARYNPNGTLSWAKRAGGTGQSEEGIGVTVLSDNSIAVTGYFTDKATFGHGEPNETTLKSDVFSDIFVAWLTP